MSTRSPGTHPVRPALSADDPQEIGGCRLHARLGSGGMAVVYLAHTRGGRPIALKVVREGFAADPGFRLRFMRRGVTRPSGSPSARATGAGPVVRGRTPLRRGGGRVPHGQGPER